MPKHNGRVEILHIDNGFILEKYNDHEQMMYRAVCEADFDAYADEDNPVGNYDRAYVKAFVSLISRLSEAFAIDAACESSNMVINIDLVDGYQGMDASEIN